MQSKNAQQITPLDFFEAVYEAYQKAETSGGSIERFYSIGGFPIRLRFAGDALIPYITPALAHLATEPVSNPALTICLWDSTSTDTLMPPPPWQIDDYLHWGGIRGFINDRIYTIFDIGANALSILDAEQHLAIYWVKTTKQIPYYETGYPLRKIFRLWLSKRGIQPVHAGAVGLPNGGVLLVGKGGAGKSTTALACLNSKLLYTSDDCCLLASSPTPTVFSIYSTGKQRANDLGRLQFLTSAISNPNRLDKEKALYFLQEHFPEKLLPRFPLRAILIPRITGKKETTFKEASLTAGLDNLVPSTISELPIAGREVFQGMVKIVKQVPCYYLNLGTEMEQIPEVILEVLSQN